MGRIPEYASCTQEKGCCGENCGFQLTYPEQTSIGVGVATFQALGRMKPDSLGTRAATNKPCAHPFPPPAPDAYENTFGQLFH